MPRMKGILPSPYGCSQGVRGPELPNQTPVFGFTFGLLRYAVTFRRLAVLSFSGLDQKRLMKWLKNVTYVCVNGKSSYEPGFCTGLYLQI